MVGYSLTPLDLVVCLLNAAFRQAVNFKNVEKPVSLNHDLCAGSYIRSSRSVKVGGSGDLSIDRSIIKSGEEMFVRSDVSKSHFVSGREMIVCARSIKDSTFVSFNDVAAVVSEDVSNFKLKGIASSVLISAQCMSNVEVSSETGIVICDMRSVGDPMSDIQKMKVSGGTAVVVVTDQDCELSHNDWFNVLGLDEGYGGLLVMKESFFDHMGGFPVGEDVASTMAVHKVMNGLMRYYGSPS